MTNAISASATNANVTTAFLGLGGNVGNRRDNLRRAVQLLEECEAIQVVARSALYETQSVEGGGSDDFLNVVVRVETTLSARGLLEIVQRVESEMGRQMPPRHGPRLIDIDILLFGETRIDDADLQIPHPRLPFRPFVLLPLCDVLENGWARRVADDW